MKHRSTTARAIVCAALMLACAAPVAAGQRPESWIGIGIQSTRSGEHETWPMRVAFTDTGADVEYPSLGCSARWTPEGAAYRETITSGDCISHGFVTTKFQAGKLFMNWTVDGEEIDIAATAVLFPTAPIS